MSAGRGLWGVVLSGGDGVRLRPLVHQVTGDERPKQYVKLLGPRTLLGQTLDRLALRISTERTVVVTVRSHTGYIAEEFHGCPAPPYVLVQPSDRGSAAGVLHATRWIARRDPGATIAVFPSDHFVLGEATLMARVVEVAGVLERHPEWTVLLGAQPASPENEYDWIDPGSPIDGHDGVVSTVRRLAPDARAGLTGGGLWNTAIVVARVSALVGLGDTALPDMSRRLARIDELADPDEESDAVHRAYALMTAASFTRDVLEPHPDRLGVAALPRVTWSALSSPRRVLDVLARMRVRPGWAEPFVDPPAIPA